LGFSAARDMADRGASVVCLAVSMARGEGILCVW
jgi:hypothetical protein